MNKEQIKLRAYNLCPFDHKCEKECTKWSVMEHIGGNKLQIKPCPCSEKADRHHKYSEAGIEPELWDFTFNDIDEDFDHSIITEYANVFLTKMDKCILNKVSILFYGSSGSGTTSVATLILKHCLDSGYTGKIFTAREVIEKLYSSRESELYDYDMLVIDGADRLTKDNLKIDFSLSVANLLDKKSVILTSNVPAFRFSGYHRDFINRISNIPNVKFKDINFREDVASAFVSVKES